MTKKYLNARALCFMTIEEWMDIDLETIEYLMDSIPERIRMVIRKRKSNQILIKMIKSTLPII
jgi:hypothetical protein